MVYIPDIVNYKPFYIQAETHSLALDTRVWGLVAKTNPFPLLPNPKEPYKNEWFDANGHEEFVEHMFYEPIEFTVSFYIKAFDSSEEKAESIIRNQIDMFFEEIRNGEFKIYDAYSGIGRQKVRFAGYSEESFKRRDTWARAIFQVKFKANDPITRIVLNKGTLVEE